MANGKRITLTKTQSETADGKQLIQSILDICHDGIIELEEVEKLYLLLNRLESRFNAIPYLRCIAREAIADGILDNNELYKLKQAFERVVPKQHRQVVSNHLSSGRVCQRIEATSSVLVLEDALRVRRQSFLMLRLL